MKIQQWSFATVTIRDRMYESDHNFVKRTTKNYSKWRLFISLLQPLPPPLSFPRSLPRSSTPCCSSTIFFTVTAYPAAPHSLSVLQHTLLSLTSILCNSTPRCSSLPSPVTAHPVVERAPFPHFPHRRLGLQAHVLATVTVVSEEALAAYTVIIWYLELRLLRLLLTPDQSTVSCE